MNAFTKKAYANSSFPERVDSENLADEAEADSGDDGDATDKLIEVVFDTK